MNQLHRLWAAGKKNSALICLVGVIVGGHVAWKWVQGVPGVGTGRDYPFYDMPRAYGNKLSSMTSHSESGDSGGSSSSSDKK